MNALYHARITHTRLRPSRHALKYRAAYVLLDLANLPRRRLFSHNRFNLFSFHDTDHGESGPSALAWAQDKLAAANLTPAGARILLLTMPRFLGHAFNPISLYLCHTEAGTLSAIIYQVNNTFGERHSYLIPVTPGALPIRQSCGKAFYVSPFMDMDLQYHFTLHPPAETMRLDIAVSDAAGIMLHAGLTGTGTALTDGALLRAALAYPFLGLKVLAGIHWEALFIWAKGVGFRRRPAPPAQPVTIVPTKIVPTKTEFPA